MKYKCRLRKFSSLLLAALILLTCSACFNSSQIDLENYTEIVNGELPEDIRLTINYVDDYFLTPYAWSADDFINSTEAQKIVIERDELLSNLEAFKKLGLTEFMNKSKDRPNCGVRLYYVLESGAHGSLLEVAISTIGYNAVVNGVEVAYDPALYEIVQPFLPENARNYYE